MVKKTEPNGGKQIDYLLSPFIRDSAFIKFFCLMNLFHTAVARHISHTHTATHN